MKRWNFLNNFYIILCTQGSLKSYDHSRAVRLLQVRYTSSRLGWLAEGVKHAAVQIAQNMLSQGMSIQQVQAITGLPAQEIRSLKFFLAIN